jgi:hypothetical protein
MKVDYVSRNGTGPSYEIEADWHGSYTIRREGTVLKRVTALTHYAGKPLWGRRKLALAAIEEAKSLIDAHEEHEAHLR